MPRQLVHLTLVAARKGELAAAWTRLGFSLDPAHCGISMADGVRLDFFTPDDCAATGVDDLQARAFLAHFAARRSGAALVGLSGEADDFLSARPEPLGGAECYFQLATPRETTAPAQANGVLGVKAVVAVADDPADFAEYLTKLTGQREMLATSAGLEIRLAPIPAKSKDFSEKNIRLNNSGSRLDVLTPPAFVFRFGGGPPDASAFRLAGLVFAVESLDGTECSLRDAGVDVKRQAGRLLAGLCAGVAVAFEPV